MNIINIKNKNNPKKLNILYKDGTQANYNVQYINILENEINFIQNDYVMHIPFSSMKWYKVKNLINDS